MFGGNDRRRRVPCPDCRASGYVYDGEKQYSVLCPRCGGATSVLASETEPTKPTASRSQHRYEVCPSCAGTAVVNRARFKGRAIIQAREADECPVCKGDGKIATRIA
jgi:DnaJ-class molecular chaperone